MTDTFTKYGPVILIAGLTATAAVIIYAALTLINVAAYLAEVL